MISGKIDSVFFQNGQAITTADKALLSSLLWLCQPVLYLISAFPDNIVDLIHN